MAISTVFERFASAAGKARLIGALEELCRAMERRVDLIEDPRTASHLFTYLTLGAGGLLVQEEIQTELVIQGIMSEPGIMACWPYATHTPLRLWRLEESEGQLSVTDLLAQPPWTSQPVTQIVSPNPQEPLDPDSEMAIGWLVAPPSRRELVVLSSITEETAAELLVSWFDEARYDSDYQEDDDLWLLEWVVDPDEQHLNTPELLGDLAIWQLKRLSARSWTRIVTALDNDFTGFETQDLRSTVWMRELIARGEPEELSTRVPEVARRALISVALAPSESYYLAYWGPILTRLDLTTTRELLPTEELLSEFGADLSGALAGYDEGALRRRPLRYLGLPPGAALWADLHPSAPISAGLEWAEARGTSAEAEELREAVATARREARWWATWAWSGFDEHPPPAKRAYTQLLHALDTLFDPRLRSLDLRGALGLKPSTLRRVQRGLMNARDTEDLPRLDTVAELPKIYAKLHALPGVGGGTIKEIYEALWEHARAWREALDAPPTHIQRASSEAQAKLSASLDDLAALFGG